MDRTRLVEGNPYFEAVARHEGFYSTELMEQLAEKGSLERLEAPLAETVPQWVKRVFRTSHDITPEWHVRIQAAFQKYTDNAVSKTVNFPNSATREDVQKAYEMAYKLKTKGVTVYRDGSRDAQVLSIKKDEKGKAISMSPVTSTVYEFKGDNYISPRPRPAMTHGTTQRVTTGCGKIYITVNEDEYGAAEVFTQMGKSGGCVASQTESISRLISLALRSGISVESVVKELKGIRCPSPHWSEGSMILSCADGIAKSLEAYMNIGVSEEERKVIGGGAKDILGACPECHNVMEYAEGCAVCKHCGFSKCG
jgi:ribonucleoside-diphosphate reductase alpha chain